MRCLRQKFCGRRCCQLSRPRLDRSIHRLGYTLLETIIAMTLVSVLMLLVWSILGIYTKLELKGVAAAQETSLLRAIHRQMRDDLLCIVPIDPGRNPSIVHEISRASGTNTPALPNGFFVGTHSDIHFAIFDCPAGTRRLMPRIVSYQSRSLTSGLLSEHEADRDDLQPGDPPPGPLGLKPFSSGIRRHVESWSQYLRHRTYDLPLADADSGDLPSTLNVDDLLVIGPPDDFADPNSANTSETPETTDAVPEVSRHQFRFFDGAMWVDQWDSALTGRLPMAIRIELEVDDYQDAFTEEPLNEEDSVERSVENEAAEFIDLNSNDLQSEEEQQLEYRWVIAIDAATRPMASSTRSPASDDEVFP